MEAMVSHKAHGFSYTTLEKGKGTSTNILAELTRVSDQVDSRGSVLFYFTGHGSRGVILADDRTISIDEIHTAIAAGRKSWGPTSRLAFFIDACHSGSLLDPLGRVMQTTVLDNPQIMAHEMADAFVQGLYTKRGDPIFKSLFAVVSARADETCLASPTGSAFTNALKSAWDIAQNTGSTVKEFITNTQKATNGSHPVSRLVPESLADEPLIQ